MSPILTKPRQSRFEYMLIGLLELTFFYINLAPIAAPGQSVVIEKLQMGVIVVNVRQQGRREAGLL